MITLESIRKMLDVLNVFDIKQINLISRLLQAYLKIRILRISSLANALQGSYEANYKATQRLLNSINQDELGEALLGLSGNYFESFIADYTELERRDARRTGYVGYLKDGITRGAGLLSLSIPYKGRALPIAATEYSSAIIAQDKSSKPILLYSLLDQLVPILAGKILIGDREFCSEENFRFLLMHGIGFAIRLKVGRYDVIITRNGGKKVNYSLKKGQIKCWRNIYYKGKIKANLVGFWDPKYTAPLYVITTIDPKKAIGLYKLRMKIEESFRDVKSKLGIKKIMTKTRGNFIKLILFSLLAYALALLIGESLRKAVLKKAEFRKFSGLHVLFVLIHRYTKRQLLSAVNSTILFIRTINIEGVNVRSVYWRAFS